MLDMKRFEINDDELDTICGGSNLSSVRLEEAVKKLTDREIPNVGLNSDDGYHLEYQVKE